MNKISWISLLAAACLLAANARLLADTNLSQTSAPAVSSISFQQWVKQLWPQAQKRGVSKKVFDAAFRGVKPDPRIEKADGNQAEFVKPIWEYLDRAVSKKNILSGRSKLRKYNSKLRRIQRKFGVDRHVLVAIWGIETRYGRNKGSHGVIQAMASMAYNGRRAEYGRKQLLAALEILQRGDTTLERLKGSWAGAMGHTQFIPTTFNAYGVDFTGDGQRDIWRSMSDALASAGNYLNKSGWQPDQRWGHEVVLPKGFDFALTGLGERKLTAEWVGLGVKRMDGQKFANWSQQASIIVPSGAQGPAFMVFKNFRAIMRYNNAVSYALAVSYLSDRLKGRPWIKQAWPKSVRPLTSSEKKELQALLNDRGYEIGDVDGRMGPKTLSALRAYQQKAGLIPDGYPSEVILRHLRGES